MRKTIYYGLFCLVIFNGLLFANPAIDPNKAISIAVQPQSQSSSSVSGQQQSLEYQQKLVEEKLDSFNKRADDQKWVINVVLTCMGFVITLMAAFIALIAIKSGREYKEAVDKAEKSADKACEWEQKAREKYENMEKQINEMTQRNLGKINAETKEHINQLFEEAQKQRSLSEKRRAASRAIADNKYEIADNLYSEILKENPNDQDDYFEWGVILLNWARLGGLNAEKYYKNACSKFQNATKNDGKDIIEEDKINKITQVCCDAFYGWSLALNELAELCKDSNEAKEYHREAIAKYQRIIEIKPDYPDVFVNWGWVLSNLADIEGYEAENCYQEACEKFQRATEIEPYNHRAYSNWGAMLSKWAKLQDREKAEKLYQQACTKYQKATEINPKGYINFSCWGATLINWSKLKDGQESENLLLDAQRFLLKAEDIKKGTGSYNLACLFALRDNEEKCKYWLKAGEEARTLETREHAMKEDDFASVRDKDWFKAIRWKGE